MKRVLFLVLALLALACKTPPPQVVPEPEALGPEPMMVPEPTNVFFMPYGLATRMLEAAGAYVAATGVERALCLTRWNSLWRGDTLRAIELFAAVSVPTMAASDTMVLPDPAVGNCWWRYPSIHWHTYDGEPSEQDYLFAAQSQAPFHVIAMGAGADLKFRIYAVRKASLKENNPR